MKHLLLILAVLFSVNCIAQNRFEKVFAKADSAFTVLVQSKSDSLLLEKSIKKIETLDRDSILIRKSDIALLYWKGFTDCAIKVNQTGEIDYNELNSQINQIVLQLKNLNSFEKTGVGRPKTLKTAHTTND